MYSLSVMVLGIIFLLGFGGLVVYAVSSLQNNKDENTEEEFTNKEMTVFPEQDNFSDKDSDLSDRSKAA